MSLFYAPEISESWELPQDEAAHCLRVLRLNVGDELEITDGKGTFYKAAISSIRGKRCYVEPIEIIPAVKGWEGYLHIAIAPTKNMERIEWLVEKAVEIGVDEITFLNCRFSERKTVKNERVERIVVSAMKQSLKAHKTVVNEMVDFNTFVSRSIEGEKYIAHCYEEKKILLNDAMQRGHHVTILIGPEGDFSQQEVRLAMQRGFVPVSLGSSRLRTETAGLVACHTFSIKNEKLCSDIS